ncbi:MAG: ABC transporter permease, partial [Oscillospiraceae bacterium]
YMSDYGVFAMVAVALLVSLALGFINGILVAKAKIMPFIATLATMMGYRGLALLSTPDAGNIPITNTAFFEMGEGMLFGVVPVPLLILIGCWVAAAVVLNKTSLGRHIYAVGGNAEAARMIVKAYAICGLMAGLSGLIVAARGQTGQPSLGAGIEMEAVAAVVLGGAVLTGGIGTVTGSVLGMIVLRIISNMINLQGDISYYFQNFITGVLVLVIVIVQSRNVLGKRQKTDSGEEGAVQQTT